jgi:hypothetical protein
LDVLRRDCGEGCSFPELAGIRPAVAARVALGVYDRAHFDLTGERPQRPLPEPLLALLAIAGE